MNEWLTAGTALLTLLIPCSFIALRGSPLERLLGLQLGGMITSLALVVLAEGYGRSIYFDLALVFAVLSYVGNLAFIRFLERWL